MPESALQRPSMGRRAFGPGSRPAVIDHPLQQIPQERSDGVEAWRRLECFRRREGERGISPMIPKRQRAAALQDASRTADANDDSRFTPMPHAHAPCSAIMSGDDYEYD